MIKALTTKVQIAAASAMLIVIAGLALVLAASRVEVADLKRQAMETKTRHEQALRIAEAREREKERRIAAQQEEVQRHADAVQEAQSEAARLARQLAAAAAERARARVAALGHGGGPALGPGGSPAGPGLSAAGVRESAAGAAGLRAPGPYPVAASGGEGAAEAARMYADLFGWAVTRLAVVGEFADRAWLAADTCERAYQAVKASSDEVEVEP